MTKLEEAYWRVLWQLVGIGFDWEHAKRLVALPPPPPAPEIVDRTDDRPNSTQA